MNSRRACVLCAFLLIGISSVCCPAVLAARLSPQQVFKRLKANAPVRWLVRMVPYEPSDPQLRIDRLKMLGTPSEDYTFVADYDELCGDTAAGAAFKVGGPIRDGQGISAILFPIGNYTIFPANVRGMLQVVQQIDMRRAAELDYRAAPLDVLLTAAERQNLAAVDLKSWAWDNYREHFQGFAQAFATLRSKNASAIAHIGEIGPGWSEPGCWHAPQPQAPGDANQMTLELPNGAKFEIKNFGVRAFLIRNVAIDTLPGRILIDFNDPKTQRIPLLDLNSDSRSDASTLSPP